MFSRIARVAAKTSFKVGKLVQSLGSSLFNSSTAMLFILMKDFNENEESALKDPIVMAAACIALTANLIMTSRTRLPAIDKSISEFKCSSSSGSGCSCCSAPDKQYCGCNRQVVATWSGLIPKMSARSSLVWSTLSAMLFTTKLDAFIDHVIGADPDDETIKDINYAFVAFIALSQLISYLSLTVYKTDKNANRLESAVRNSRWHFDSDDLKTLVIVLLHSIPTLRFAFYSTVKSIHKIPGANKLPEDDIDILAAISTISAFITGIMSVNGQVNKFFREESDISWFNPVNIANIIDSLFVVGANTASMAISSSTPYAWHILLPSLFFGSVAGLVSYIFNNEAYESALTYEKLQREAVDRGMTPEYAIPISDEKSSSPSSSESKLHIEIPAEGIQDETNTIEPWRIAIVVDKTDDTKAITCKPGQYYKTNCWSPTKFKAPRIALAPSSTQMTELSRPLLDTRSTLSS